MFSVLPVSADNRGVPFIHNYLSTEYGAHNRSFDVACDDYGSVYFANFECLLYYDGSSWRKIYAPEIKRFTRVVWDKRLKRIWVGGFNFFGYLEPDGNGVQQLKLLKSPGRSNEFGEVNMICLHGKDIFVHVLDNRVYKVEQSSSPKQTTLKLYKGNTSFINTNMEVVALGYTSGIHLSFKYGDGLIVRDATRMRTIKESDGLCSNNVNFVMFDRQHTVWGATDHGIFAMEMPSPFSHLTEGQGLNGDVYCINNIGETIYVGTLQGLFRIDNGKVTHVPGINLACWQLTKDGNTLYASTTTGVYHITPTQIKQIETDITYATIPAPQGGYYTAEDDSIYYVPNEDDDYHYTRIAHIERANDLKLEGKNLIVETVNGQKWRVSLTPPFHKICLRKDINPSKPKMVYTDAFNRIWETSSVGDSLKILGHKTIDKWIHPLYNKVLNAIYCGKENSLWIGGDFGVINCDLAFINEMKKVANSEPLYIRQVAVGDSIYWGGYTKDGYKPLTDVSGIEIPSDAHDLKIYFSSQYPSFVCPTQYRYRTRGESWSTWSEQTSITFHNLVYGDTEMDIEAKDLFGNITTAHVAWHVDYPFYLKWWAFVIYFIILSFIGRVLGQYRMKKLKRDRDQLEKAVKSATAEISQQNEVLSLQKEELSQRSTELASTLEELKKTQAELVHAERTATAGKLTQGLIDRILNPINYINNFSKLTSGLAKDLRQDIEDEKENMSEDNYEDCEDILDMMTTNLTKIEGHGVNTTRTLRSMEALLNHQTGTLRSADITALCDQVVEVVSEHYKTLIAQYHITFSSDIPNGIIHNVDSESLSNVLKALLANGFYAVEKRLIQAAYPNPEVKLTLSKVSSNEQNDKSSNASSQSHITFVIHDNGIGIEDSIKDKVFDPFFTTKPTSEASGVGLYLAREIIQDHKGTITVNSEKENFTDFIITI